MAANKKNNPVQGLDIDTLAKMDIGTLLQFLTSLNPTQAQELFQNLKIDPSDERFQLQDNDPRLNMLYSLKSLVPSENAQIIDRIISIFKVSSRK